MKQFYEIAAVKFLGMFNMLTVKECSETGLSKYLTNRVFRSL